MHSAQVKLFFPFIRTVNYHDVPPSEAQQFEQHLQYYVKHFSSVNYEDLINFHNNIWDKNKPGLIISFDDGFRSFHEVVAPLLEKYGFTGWFLISPATIDIPVEEQHYKSGPKNFDCGDTRVFLTWNQIIELDKNHVIGCHTLNHCRLSSTLTKNKLQREIITSKNILEEKLGHEIPVFAWAGGEESSYSRKAAKVIRKAKYKVVFLTNNSVIKPHTDLHLLNRTNIESSYSSELMRFQISGFMDIVYTLKRRRVNRMIKIGEIYRC